MLMADRRYPRNARGARSRAREQRRRRRRRYRNIILTELVILILCMIGAVIVYRQTRGDQLELAQISEEQHRADGEAESEQILIEEEEEAQLDPDQQRTQVLEEADKLAAMYDYDGAVSCLTESEFYSEDDEEMQSRISSWQAQKAACVAWEPEDVTHIFYHSLIVDPSKCFDGDYKAEDYNQYNVTIDEFNKITQIMYDKGYVMVSMHDMCEIDDEGNVTGKQILLPEGKTPFVLSQDDVSYYHYMTGDGFAQKLIVDEDGKVKNTYVNDDGTVSVGDYDMVPLIDDFVEEHPDFSYHGHKGTVALTGYEGVLGYRTDEVYRTREESRLTSYQREFFEENPDFDEAAWQNEVDEATKVADAMKAEGWEFASHTWGHIDPLAKGYEAFKLDTDRWEENVRPIVGDTDIIIYAFGADITTNELAYSADNEYFQYLKALGFHIYCDVDSQQYFVVFGSDHMRMGRRNIDGYRMYYNPDKLADLFDVDDVWDSARPDTVAQIE